MSLNLFLARARSLSGILFNIFAPILEKEFFKWSVLEFYKGRNCQPRKIVYYDDVFLKNKKRSWKPLESLELLNTSCIIRQIVLK